MTALVYLFLVALSVQVHISYAVNKADTHASSQEVSPLAAELCQYLELEDTGVEGEVNSSEYKLKGVTVLFRHGERSPIVKDDLSKHRDCAPFRKKDRSRFEDLTKILDSKEFRTFLKVDKEYKDYPLYPLRSECSPGNLTAEGSLQLLRLGNHLRKAYENSTLFDKENNLDVKVTVSPFRRTFQSAVAFISSFLYPMKEAVREVFVKHSNDTFLCTNSLCQCPTAANWRSLYEKQHHEYSLNDKTGLRERTQRIFGGIEWTRKGDPVDVLLGRYVCRRHPLPCTKDGECVTLDLLKEILQYNSRRAVETFNLGNQFITARLLTAEAQAILGYVARMGDELRQFNHTNRIQLFAGHDVTVDPVLRVLRLPFVDYPRYATHILFEIYHDKEERDFLRLVYNGKDHTAELPFCGGKSMCPMATFSRFARSGIFEALGYSNATTLCDPSFTPQPNNPSV